MNFEKIAPVDTATECLDIAFRRARLKSVRKDLKGNWLEIIRKKEQLKLDVAKDQLCTRLLKIESDFPSLGHLPFFYHKLLKLTLDLDAFQAALRDVGWARRQIALLHKNAVRAISKIKTRDEIKQKSAETYGRISSILKQVDRSFSHLNEVRAILRGYPDIKNKAFHVCIYGFPNIGKTTLLNKLTGTTAKVAGYSFTTKSINSGTIAVEEGIIQVLDVPGTLARPDKMNLIEQQAELVLEDIASVVIFPLDITEPYPLTEQLALLDKIRKAFAESGNPVLLYLAKTDILSETQILEFRKNYPSLVLLSFEELKQQVVELGKTALALRKEQEEKI